MNNSGFSLDMEINKHNPPFTTNARIKGTEDSRKYHVCASIYPINSENNVFYHEGVHFLAKSGPKKERLIIKDIPLANVLDAFYQLREDPNRLNTLLPGEADPESISDLAKGHNPFIYSFDEHSETEHFEAIMTAVNAYFISKERGERAGINYLLGLLREAKAIKY